MIGTIASSLKTALNPKAWLFSLGIFLIQFVAFVLIGFPVIDLFLTLAAEPGLTGPTFVETVPKLFLLYPFEMLSGIVLGLLMLSLQTLLFFFYSKAVENNQNFREARSFAFQNIRKSFTYAVFLMVLFFVLSALLWFSGIIFETIPVLAGIISILLFVLYLYAIIGIIFTIPAVVANNLTIKQGLRESWEFVAQNVLKVLVFIILIGIANTIFSEIQTILIDLFADDLIVLGIIALTSAYIYAFNSLAVAIYYFKKKLNKNI